MQGTRFGYCRKEAKSQALILCFFFLNLLIITLCMKIVPCQMFSRTMLIQGKRDPGKKSRVLVDVYSSYISNAKSTYIQFHFHEKSMKHHD